MWIVKHNSQNIKQLYNIFVQMLDKCVAFSWEGVLNMFQMEIVTIFRFNWKVRSAERFTVYLVK